MFKLSRNFFSGLALTLWSLGGMSLQAEDWTTNDGKVYHDVSVIRAEPDAVTILHHDGGALVPLKNLPTDLQQRFHYDPTRAATAAAARAAVEAQEVQSLKAEIAKKKSRDLALLVAQHPNPPDSYSLAQDREEASWEAVAQTLDPTHHSIGELVDTNQRLRFDHDLVGHYTMSNLVGAAHSLSADPNDPNHHTMGELFHSGSNL